jgi:hypothetical protein
MPLGKIEDLDLVDEIIGLVAKGMSARGIERHFKDHGIALSWQTVNRFIKKMPQLVDHLIQQDNSLKHRVVASILDTSERISFIAQEAESVYQLARDKEDLSNSLRALSTIGEACILLHKLIGSPESITDDNHQARRDAGDLDALLDAVKTVKTTVSSP